MQLITSCLVRSKLLPAKNYQKELYEMHVSHLAASVFLYFSSNGAQTYAPAITLLSYTICNMAS